jgi:hypothetical protein
VIDLFEEIRELLTELSAAGAEYAVAGAVALAVHGVPRATTDIDLLVHPDHVDRILGVARGLGFDLEAMPMRFGDGMEVRRVSKIEGEETLTLDLLLVNENLHPIWEDRIELETDFGPVWVVSREGLIRMKSWAGRDQDLADIRRLEEIDR